MNNHVSLQQGRDVASHEAPRRSQHDALDALSYALLKRKANYILDADIRGFFDNLDKSWMIQFMEHRVADPRSIPIHPNTSLLIPAKSCRNGCTAGPSVPTKNTTNMFPDTRDNPPDENFRLKRKGDRVLDEFSGTPHGYMTIWVRVPGAEQEKIPFGQLVPNYLPADKHHSSIF